MATSLNKVTLIGHLGRDPEYAYIKDKKYAKLSVATSESWKDKATNEYKTKTEWHKIVIFNEGIITHILDKALVKGSKVYVEGKLQTREWEDQGTKKFITEIQLGPYHGMLMILSMFQPSVASGIHSADTQSFEDSDLPF